MKKILNTRTLILFVCVFVLGSLVSVYGQGNPRPGAPHDTIIIHVQKGDNGPKTCGGGHSLFIREFDGIIPETFINFTMVDWVQVDNDGDGLLDEDEVDGIDNDGDGFIDEDPPEQGSETTALDCDAWDDGEVTIQIRDTHPALGYVSTQEGFMRMIGKPEQNFAFISYANQIVSCEILDYGPDGIPNTEDDIAECLAGDSTEWIKLAEFNCAAGGCVKRVKIGGKNPQKGGGKTPLCDITEGFRVDVIADTNLDGVIDEYDELLANQSVFSVSCLDNPDTIDVDESLYCPLSSVIWDVDEESTTEKATAKITLAHTGASKIIKGKLTKK